MLSLSRRRPPGRARSSAAMEGTSSVLLIMKMPARLLTAVCAIALPVAVLAAQQSQPTQQATPQQPTTQQPPAQQPPAQQGSQQQQPPTIRTGINYVRVDALVSDKNGNPVMDLTQDEFSVAEDGKPQKIDSFSVVKITESSQLDDARPPTSIHSNSEEEREAARPDVRLFVILLDDYHVRRGSDLAVRKPLMDFIQNQLSPVDMVALMYPLTPVTELHFSRDRDALMGAVNRFE